MDLSAWRASRCIDRISEIRYRLTFINIMFIIIIIISFKKGLIDQSLLGAAGIFIGLISIIYAVYSLESTTNKLDRTQNQLSDTQKRLKDIQLDYWNVRGVDKYDEGEYDDAIDALNRAIAIDPDFSKAWNSKGNVLAAQRKYLEAIEAHNKAIELNSGSAKFLANKGSTLLDHGKDLNEPEKLEEAIRTFEMAIKLDSKLYGAWSNIGIAYSKLGKVDDAIKAHKKAIKLNSQSAKAWNNLGEAYLQQQMPKEALEAFDKALEVFFRSSKSGPIDAGIWYNKGIALKARNKKGYQGVIHAYNRAIELDPLKLDAWNNKGWIFFEQGFLSAAIESYKKALEINPNDKQVWINKYLALNSLSRYYETESDYVNSFKYKYAADEALARSEDQQSYICYIDTAFIERSNILKTMQEK